MQITTRAEGFTEAARDLRALGTSLADLSDELDPIAKEGAETASNLAPKLTGETSRSIRPSTGPTSATISAPFPAGPINYKTNRFMDEAARDLTIKAVDLMEAALSRTIERHL